MEFASYQIQVFTSLAIILGAAFVILIRDVLKGDTEALRELVIEHRMHCQDEETATAELSGTR